MALIEVTISQLQNAAKGIRNANESFIEAANNLKNAADALASTWEGQSHDVFVAEQERIDNWYRIMSQCVSEYANTMDAAAGKYMIADMEARSAINKH